MKTKIRRFSKSVLSVILAMTLIMSTMLIGTISVNATISGLSALYFTPDSSAWAKDSATFKLEYTTSGGTNTRVPFDLIDSENSVYKATLDSSTTYTKFKFWRYSSDGKTDWNSSNEFDTIPTGMNYFTKTNTSAWDSWKPDSHNGTWSTYGSGSGGGTAVTDENLLSVLKGDKVMFYGAEPYDWDAGTYFVMTTNSTDTKVTSGDMPKNNESTDKVTLGGTGYKFTALCAPAGTYYLGHWASGMQGKVSAGGTYIVGKQNTSTGFTQLAAGSDSNYLYSYNNGATLTATTTCNSEIKGGSTLTVNTSPSSAGTSTIGKNNSFEYYIGDSSGKYYKYTLSGGSINTSSLADGTYTLKTVLTDGNIYVVGDTDTFTVSSKTDLAKPNFEVSNSNVVTSKDNATITVTSSGDSYPPRTTYTLLDASDNVVSGVTWNDNIATVEFADLSSDDAKYKVKVSAEEAKYNPAVSDEFNLKKVQLYSVTLEANDDAEVTGTYIDAYGATGQTIEEGKTADVPSGNKVHVNATVTDTANKTFNKFTYNGQNFGNNTDITITADGTISTVIDSVTYRTVKIAVIEYADYKKGNGNKLTSNNVTYTFGGSEKTATMTAVAEDPTAYFTVPSKMAGNWSGKGHTFYIYEVSVPSTVTSINVGGVKDVTLNDTIEYYGVFHYDKWQSINYMTSDRYYKVSVVADTRVDPRPTVIAEGTDSVTYGSDKLYKYNSNIVLTATPSDPTAFSYDYWSDGTSKINSPYTVVGDATLTAFFKDNQSYAITLDVSDANLNSITSNPAGSTYEGNTVTITVTPKNGYKCTGITVAKSSGGNITDITDNRDGTYTFTMPGDSVTVTPTIVKKATYTVTASSNDTSKGTVSPESKTVTEGETVTLTASAITGNQFTAWTLDGDYAFTEGSSLTTAEITFTPSSDVTAVASFAEQTVTPCNYRIVGNSKIQFLTNGWTNYSDAKSFDQYVNENVYRTTLIVTSTSNGENQFSLINSGGNKYGSHDNNGTNILNNNSQDNGYGTKNSNNPFYFGSTGRYYLYVDQSGTNPKVWAEQATDTVLLDENFNIVGVFDGTTGGEITVNYPAETNKSFVLINKDGYKIQSGGASISNSGSINVSRYNNFTDSVLFTSFTATTGGNYTIKYTGNEQSGTFSITSDNTSSGVTVYAKDGTLRAGFEKYASMATTEITSGTLGASSRVGDDYSLGYAEPGSTITVKTTIDEANRSKYYVKAFCVNGESYSIIDASKADTTNGVYTLSYTIPEDFDGDKIEITPIYFYIDEINTIYFYVEGFNDKVKNEWGDTISAYVYYTGGKDSLVENQNALGGYPGQPMVLEGGKYYMQVPKYLNGNTSKPVSGVTLNNYVWDEIHNTGGDSAKQGANCQTYDFEDFYKISQLESADNIYFSFKYRDSVNNNPATVPSDKNYTTFTNGWEYLTDYRGRYVDIFGNVLTEAQVKNTPELRIISNGYVPNYIGNYATDWTIYADPNNDKSYSKKVGTITSSGTLYNTADEYSTALGTSAQKDTYLTTYTALQDYKNVPALITYEKSIDAGDQPGNRSDGRWYYSKKSDTVNVKTRIEYGTNEVYDEDPFIKGTAIGTTTGTKAYFTNENFSGLTEATGLVDNTKYFTFKADTDTNGKYMFVGWYLLKDGVYSLITKSAEAKAPITSSETYVARFIQTPTGSLTVTHDLFSNAPYVDGTEGKPAANGGLGTCYAKVEIVDPTSGAVIKTYNETTAAIVIDNKYIKATSTYQLRITLRTVMTGLNTYYAGYVNKSTETKTGGYLKISDEVNTNTVTITRELSISGLFIDDEGKTLPSPKVGALNYYSDILPVTIPYKLTFNYKDRFNGDKFYVVKGKLTENYIAQNMDSNGDVTLTNAFIMEHAPYEDNFGKTIKWSESTISKNNVDGTLTAVIDSDQTARQVVVNYRTNSNMPWDALVLDYAALIQNNGEYIEADETDASDNNKKFSYWGIYTDSACTNLVAKCYSRKFNYIAYQDYYIAPVYAETPETVTTPNVSTTLNFLEYSRNQWTDENGEKTTATDRLYADFALAFNKDGLMLNDYTGTDIECGMVMEVCGKLTTATDGSYITDLSQYNYDTNQEALKAAMLSGDKSYEGSGAKRNIIKTTIDNSKLNNKNRIEFYQGFNNSTNNPLYVIKAYSYIKVKDTITLSAPVYFNLYDVANLTYTIS